MPNPARLKKLAQKRKLKNPFLYNPDDPKKF